MVATATRRTCGAEPRLMGDGRALNFIRCALPTTEFFETPSRRPISDALRPASQSRMSSATRSFVQVMRLPLCFWLYVAAPTTYRHDYARSKERRVGKEGVSTC